MAETRVQVRFPPHLRRFIDLPDTVDISAENVRSAVDQLEKLYPGLSGYLLHENGELRQHVNIFLGEKMVTDRIELSDSLQGIDEMIIMQALSGG